MPNRKRAVATELHADEVQNIEWRTRQSIADERAMLIEARDETESGLGVDWDKVRGWLDAFDDRSAIEESARV